MKRAIALAAVLLILATPVFAQSSDPSYNGPDNDFLMYSAYQRCRCGRGLAYYANSQSRPSGADVSWSCSGVLRGIVPQDTLHHGPYPVVKYNDYSAYDGALAKPGIMSEQDDAAIADSGATTRPSCSTCDDNINDTTNQDDDCCNPNPA